MRVEQKGDPVLGEHGQDITLPPMPAVMIAHAGEGAVPGADPGHLLHAFGKKGHGVRNVISGQDKQIRLQGGDLLGIAPHLSPGHVNPGMDVGELDHPQGPAEGQGELPDLISLAAIGSPVSGENQGRRGQPTHPGLQKPAALEVHGKGRFPAVQTATAAT